MAYPSVYNAQIEFTDEKGLKTVINHPIDTPTNIPWAALDVAAAATHLDDLVAAYGALSTANITRAGVTVRSVDNSTLGDDGSDVTDEAALIVYVNPTGELPKYAMLRIPSPVESLFEDDKVTVDLDNADLATLIDEIDAGVFVSDGEQINGDLGTNGVKRGWWRSKARSTK